MISVHVLLQNAAKNFYLKILNGYAVFIPGIIFFLGGGEFPPKIYNSLKRLPNCVL